MLAPGLEQHRRLGDVEGDPVPGTSERAPHGVLGGAGSKGRGSRHPSRIRAWSSRAADTVSRANGRFAPRM
ncbi:hypothetical protein STXM2123_3276 [Streptomyces sp. F-3]|nr:hypothetical protein STXM2123_3276 [Streptomyces sp. F-3]